MERESDRNGNNLFLIPGDDVLDSVNEAELLKIYWRFHPDEMVSYTDLSWPKPFADGEICNHLPAERHRYINSIQTVCNNIVRFGGFEDGGKEICLEENFVPSDPCVAYSFGCGFHFDFENALYKMFGCKTYTFDPSINIKGKEYLIPTYVNLTLEGLSGNDETQSNGWRMKTLKTFLKERNQENSVIDFLKIDVEGSEWAALAHTFNTDILSRVRQLSMEVHYGRYNPKSAFKTRPIDEKYPLWGGVPAKQQLVVLRTLFEKGFRIFARERNYNSVCKASTTAGIGAITTVNELYFINTNFMSADNSTGVRKTGKIENNWKYGQWNEAGTDE